MRTVFLTGAGMSAESGIPTFRDALTGLWARFDAQSLATPEAFRRDPALCWGWYRWRAALVRRAAPNAGHLAIAAHADAGHAVAVVTQNVDDLHERAGSRNVLHMHGELLKARCLACGARVEWRDDLLPRPPCPRCGARALRPDVVWFGEVPYHLDEVYDALWDCDLFAAIGTSGTVHPAAGFVRTASSAGARTVEMNLARSEVAGAFDEVREGTATVVVPAWVEEVLARG